MIKIVYDTNVIVSALLKEGWPSLGLELVLHKKVKLFISQEILEENHSHSKKKPGEMCFLAAMYYEN